MWEKWKEIYKMEFSWNREVYWKLNDVRRVDACAMKWRRMEG
jgi:hypothetical protein